MKRLSRTPPSRTDNDFQSDIAMKSLQLYCRCHRTYIFSIASVLRMLKFNAGERRVLKKPFASTTELVCGRSGAMSFELRKLLRDRQKVNEELNFSASPMTKCDIYDDSFDQNMKVKYYASAKEKVRKIRKLTKK